MKRDNAAGRFARTPWLVAALLAWLLATAWVRPLMAPDEGRYAGVALGMLRSGDWLVPRLDGLPFFHKPPLFYWIGAAAMSVTGPVEWAARLPSVLGAARGGGHVPVLAPLVDSARRAAVDRGARDHAFLFSGRAVRQPRHARGRLHRLHGVAGGRCDVCQGTAGAMARAPRRRLRVRRSRPSGQGPYRPGAASDGDRDLGRRDPQAVAGMRMALWLPGWALLLAVAGPWFVAMQIKYPEFFDYFVVTQHFRRFASSGFNNEHGFWFYLPVLAGFTLPWFAWMLVPRGKGGKGGDTPSGRTDIDWLMWIWLAVIVCSSRCRAPSWWATCCRRCPRWPA
jgi:hypothetical protein